MFQPVLLVKNARTILWQCNPKTTLGRSMSIVTFSPVFSFSLHFSRNTVFSFLLLRSQNEIHFFCITGHQQKKTHYLPNSLTFPHFRISQTSTHRQNPPLVDSETMNYRRDHRSSRSSLFDDGLEEGGLRASSSYSSREINEQDNDKSLDSLQDRVTFLKRLTGDIHEEVESHNHLLDKMGNSMDISRGVMSGTMDRFKMVFEKKSSRKTCTLAGFFIVSFLLLYYLIRFLRYFTQG